jgi:mannose-6-phosphate isomerase-like protein (cupin superfamily)
MEQMAFRVLAGEAHDVSESPFGSVGVLHRGADLSAWWIRKDRENIDPEWTVFDREDFLYVVEGQLRLELDDALQTAVTLRAGSAFVIPARTPFRGYRWPRDSDDACVFIAVSVAGAEAAKLEREQRPRI